MSIFQRLILKETVEYEVTEHTFRSRTPSGQNRQHKPYIRQSQSLVPRECVCTEHYQFFEKLLHLPDFRSVVPAQCIADLESSRFEEILKILNGRQRGCHYVFYLRNVDVVQSVLQRQHKICLRDYLYYKFAGCFRILCRLGSHKPSVTLWL